MSQRDQNLNHVWDVNTLAWVRMQQPILEAGSVTIAGSIVVAKTALTAASPAATTVGVTSAQAVAANTNRKGLALVNTSANRISLGLGVAAVLDSGITLYGGGGSWVMGEYDYTTGAVYAIASGANSNLTVQEFT